jgi:hypothetical protein
VIDDIYDFAGAQGFEIDGITQEGGAGQVEINLRHGDPVKLADEVFFFKRLIREAAFKTRLFRDIHGLNPLPMNPVQPCTFTTLFWTQRAVIFLSGHRAARPMYFTI